LGAQSSEEYALRVTITNSHRAADNQRNALTDPLYQMTKTMGTTKFLHAIFSYFAVQNERGILFQGFLKRQDRKMIRNATLSQKAIVDNLQAHCPFN
jgi:hypothetical protein